MLFKCQRVRRLTFEEPSSLKRIGEEVFDGSGLRDLHSPISGASSELVVGAEDVNDMDWPDFYPWDEEF